MKKIIKATLFLGLAIVSFFGCSKDDEVLSPTYGKPTIALVSGVNSGSFAIGRILKIPFLLTAEGYLQKLEVTRNATPFATIPLASIGTRTFDYETLVENAWLGTTQVFTFKLFDNKGNISNVFTYTATISNLVPTYTIVPVTLNNETFNKITGIINFDETLTPASKWIISGTVTVDGVSTLTIAPGTTIYAENTATSLTVLAGGKIIASGTAALPIVFTTLNVAPGQSGTPAAGNWIGLTINGSATATNSGVYKYVRLEYAGLAGTSSIDAFRFINVGNGTEVDYIQCFRSADNGIRINGGNVNLKHIIGTSNAGVGIRFGVGWIGKGQFWVATMTNTAMTGIQGRDIPSNPILSNITVTGSILNGGTVAEGEAIRIRNSAKAKIYNALLSGVNTSFSADGSTNFVPTSEVFLRNSACFNNINNGTGGFGNTANTFSPSNAAYLSINNNSITPFTITNNYVGTSSSNAVNPTTLDPFFEAANYVGAVQTGSDWTVGWTRNTNGSIRL